ncbi:MAG: nucleotidyltransferase domain-containing protein [Anaerolineae bacterium]
MSKPKTVEVSLDLPQKSRLTDFCRRWKVSEMAVFGSALREDFGPNSDVDVLVSFEDDARWTLFDLVRMEQELEALVRRPVDLVPRVAVEQSENYIRRKSILDNAAVIYAAG